MYEILLDGKNLYYPGDTINSVLKARIKTELNDSGCMDITVPEQNPLYNEISERSSCISVLKDGKEIWEGEVREITKNMQKDKKLYVVGELAYLADSIQPQRRYQNVSPVQFLTSLITQHNSQVEDKKKFYVGIVTVVDSNDSIYRYTNYENTLDAIREKLCEQMEGYLRVRKVDGLRYLDLLRLEDYGKTCQQPIEFGRNLLDYADNISTDDIATCIIPLGAKLDEGTVPGLEGYTTIESVNQGKDYIYNQEAVNHFGFIKKVVHWEDVTVPANLLKKAQEWLSQNQFAKMSIEIDAVDLSNIKLNIDTFGLGDYVNVKAKPFGVNAWFYIREKETDLLDFSKNTITVGDVTKKSYTKQVQSEMKATIEELPDESSILKTAQKNSSNLIKLATNGYIVLMMNDEGRPKELLVMDTPDVSTAQKVWRWNINGLGYSSTGYNGTYGTAITMDGRIVADFVTTGTMQADRIKGGTLKLGGAGNGNGKAQIMDAAGNVLVTLDMNGITLAEGVKIGWDNISGSPEIPTKTSELTNDSNFATTGDIPSTKQITQITKDTLKTESVEATNLKITGGSIDIRTESDSTNVIVLNGPNSTATYAPHLVQLVQGENKATISPSGIGSTTGIREATFSSGSASFRYNGNQKLRIQAREDGYGEYYAPTGHDFRGVVVLANGGVLGDFTPITSDRRLKENGRKLDIEKTAEFIYSLVPREYTLKRDTEHIVHHGLYADEVYKALNGEERKLYTDNSENEKLPEDFRHKTLCYDDLHADYIATLQSQNRRISDLEKRMKEVESKWRT